MPETLTGKYAEAERGMSGIRKRGRKIDKKIQQVLALIHSKYKGNLNLEQVAGWISLHPDYLSRKFRMEMGMAYHQYVLRFRIKKAAFLLAQTDKKIKEIYREVGFTRPEIFSRNFNKIMGMSPRTFRNRYASTLGGLVDL